MTVNERIKQKRTELGLSASKVAEQLHISRATLYRYENADIEKIPTAIIDGLSTIFNVSPMELLGHGKPSIAYDEFTYAMYNETRALTSEQREQLLAMARFLKSEVDKDKK